MSILLGMDFILFMGKVKNTIRLSLAILSLLLAGCSNTSSSNSDSINGSDTSHNDNTSSTGTSSTSSTSQGGDSYDDHDGYYSSISTSDSGTTLLSKLRSLNSSKRKSTVGYKKMGTSSSSPFKYTDYDPSTVQYDSSGQPYGTKIISFYSGKSVSSFNKEHVWPDSRGGGQVENDIHMPRPTVPSENGSRGNSFYVEGQKSSSSGWDPAAESFGIESYRGDSARIIFYCVIASSSLSLIDSNTDDKNNKTMGKLSDLLKWNLKYSVDDREIRRNSGAQYLQGNRNPFIDHPEYACKIWGSTNSTTKSICGL